MAQKPFTDIKLVVRASVKGHISKGVWVAVRPSLAASFVFSARDNPLKSMKNGFAQFGIILIIVAVATIVSAISYVSNNSKSNENKRVFETFQFDNINSEEQQRETIIPENTVLCNGIYYTQCANNLKFICPKSGTAYCEDSSTNLSALNAANTKVCNGKEWLNCPEGYNFYCPSRGDAQCVPGSSSSINNQQMGTSTSSVPNSNSQPNQTVSSVEKLLQEEIVKQNSWYEEYLQKQAEIDKKLKPVNEEWDRVYAQMQTECPIDFYTGQKAQDCDRLALRLGELEAEARKISGIYPERNTLPQIALPQIERWNIESMSDGLSGTMWSPYSTTRYRWSCIGANSCTLYSY
ncbi:MAG: hypothetical protein PHW72_01470 [Candidatus Pacebacteria bacterium]|nr:hypothetical protein [Candidatus Paceibacterota bacterium]